jgi:hypothetical protein
MSVVSAEMCELPAASSATKDLPPGTSGNPIEVNGHGTHVAGTIGAMPNHAGSASDVDNVLTDLSVDDDATDDASRAGTNYFDGRFLRADDLRDEQTTTNAAEGVDLLMGGAGDDAVNVSTQIPNEYKYVPVRRTAVDDTVDLADWRTNFGAGG